MLLATLISGAALIFVLGMGCGIWALAVNLRHNGWRLYLRVDEKESAP